MAIKDRKVLKTVKCNTVGDLLDRLTEVAQSFKGSGAENMSDLLDATIDGPDGEVYTGFKIIQHKLSDGSNALDFELFED